MLRVVGRRSGWRMVLTCFRKERQQACERVGMCVLASAVGDWVMGRKSLGDLTFWS